eukprot:PhM_4_TR15886/c4_g1_i2/m.17026
MTGKTGMNWRVKDKCNTFFSREWLRKHLAPDATEAQKPEARRALEEAVAELLGKRPYANTTAGVYRSLYAGKRVGVRPESSGISLQYMRCLVPHPCPGCRVRANSSPTGRVHRVVRTERRPEQIVPCSQRNCKFGGTVKVSLAHKCQNCELYVCRGHTDVKKRVPRSRVPRVAGFLRRPDKSPSGHRFSGAIRGQTADNARGGIQGPPVGKHRAGQTNKGTTCELVDGSGPSRARRSIESQVPLFQ